MFPTSFLIFGYKSIRIAVGVSILEVNYILNTLENIREILCVVGNWLFLH